MSEQEKNNNAVNQPQEETNSDCCQDGCCCEAEKENTNKSCRCKKVRKILVRVGAAVLALLVILLLFRDVFITAAVTHAGSFIMGTKVELKKFSSSLTGKVDIQGLTVANPEGFHNPYAFSLERVYVDLSIPSLFTKEIIVREILVTGMQVDLEAKLNRTNLGVLQENISRLIPAPTQTDNSGDVKTVDEKEEPQVIIEKLTINNNNISFSNSLLKLTAKVPLVPISMTDVGKGMTVTETINTVFIKIITSVFDACAGVGGVVGDSLKDAGSFLKNSAEGITGGIGKTTSGITESTGKFFKGLTK